MFQMFSFRQFIKEIHGNLDLFQIIEFYVPGCLFAGCVLPRISILKMKRMKDDFYPYSHVGMLFVDKKSRPSHMLSKLNIMAGFDPTEPIKLFKESSFSPFLCNPIDIWMTFEDEEFTNGDIICFQKSPPVKNKPKQIFDFSHLFKQQYQYRYPDVPYFLSSKAGEAIWYASRQTRDGNHLLSPVSSSEFDASALKK